MADDAEASLWEGLIARVQRGASAVESDSGQRRPIGRCLLRACKFQYIAVPIILFILVAVVWSVLPANIAGQSRGRGADGLVADGTPVSGVIDPLDNVEPEPTAAPDPLDGTPQARPQADEGAPEDLEALPVVRSGRSRSAPDSSVAYDGDVTTAWPAGEQGSRWVWFDLGEKARIREVRWLTTGAGTLSIDVSNDREKWREIASAPLETSWSGLTARHEAQFLRLSFSDQTSSNATLIEFTVYGQQISAGVGGGRTVELAQERKQRASDRQEQRTKGARRAQRANDAAPAADEGATSDNSRSGVQISAKPGKTQCKGDKAKCRANEGKTRVEEDCATEGTCAIDVRADGGTATCDASGGGNNETGQGEGKRSGRGGRCEAVANGGTVTIGDINP